MKGGFIIRNAKVGDIPQMVEVENGAWEEEVPNKDLFFTEEHFKSHLEIFPEGQFVAELDGKIIGYLTLQKILADPKNPAAGIGNWFETSGQGFLTNHNPNGNVIFGVALGALPNNVGAGPLLVERGIEFMIEQGCDCGFLVGRIPGYHEYADRMSAEEYITTLVDGKSLDPQIRMYTAFGIRVGGLIPNYIEDPKSLNYGVLLVLDNPDK